ncbi:LGFP repeat-containing protein [uncultured Corynebacterium sp.]|uniref:LGFP repeat-containing protein n=1 Tax=uncultured Corynebacterium sp. TaxID=159447 RepID=UPI0025977A88|nr:hypothetical protein [uncultured Corynebacterium sp.]
MNLNKKLAGAAAALALATGLVACSSDEGSSSSSSTSTVEDTATETSVSTTTSAKESDTAATSTETSAKEGEGETVEVTTADGATTLVPQGVSDAMEEYGADWGEPVSVEETANGWIVAYDAEHYVTWNENTGGAPTWGEISNNWLTNVRADSSLGFPTAPEEELADGSGWTQEFEHGTIEWVRGADGIFTANVTQK